MFTPPLNRDGKPCEFCQREGALCRYHAVIEDGEFQALEEVTRDEDALATRSDVVTLDEAVQAVSPDVGLMEEIARTEARVKWLAKVVKQTCSGEVGGVVWQSDAKAWLEMFKWERYHYKDLCRIAINAGLAARRVRLAEEQARMIARVVAGVLADVGADARDPAITAAIRKRMLEAAAVAAAEARTIELEAVRR